MSDRGTGRAGHQRALTALATAGTSTGLAATAVQLIRLARSVAVGPSVALDPATVLVGVASAAAAVLAARLALCSAACVVAVVVGSGGAARHAARLAMSTSPRALRPGLGAVLAGSIAIGVAGPALAAAPVGASSRPLTAAAVPGAPTSAAMTEPAMTEPAMTEPAAPTAVLAAGQGLPSPGWSALPAPGWLPAAPRRAPAPAQAAPAVHLVTGAGSRSGAADDEVVVRRGDTLWHLAARSLGPSAATAEIAAEWPRWWRANRDVIGPDPDLLVPGTRLRAPAPATTDP